MMWISEFFYGAPVLCKSVTELADADVLHVTFIALDIPNWDFSGHNCVHFEIVI